MVGNKDISFRVDAFDGTIKGAFEDTGKNRDLDVEFDTVDVGRIDLITANIGFPLDGKLGGALKLAMPEGKASKANSYIAAAIVWLVGALPAVLGALRR